MTKPRKHDQDALDACICLLVGLHFAEGRKCLMVGDQLTGYILVPHNSDLLGELEKRCDWTNRVATEWVRLFYTGQFQTE
jgi:predicted RNase H-like nuclease